MLAFYLFVFAVSSGWLFSPGPQKWREVWEGYFENSKYFSRLKYLAICQLCVGVWIALATEWIFFEFDSLEVYVVLALNAGAVSWLLGAFTTMCLWTKAYYELKVKELCQK